MTGLVVVLILVIAAAVGYWIVLSRKYSKYPRADEIHEVKTGDLWSVLLYRYKPKSGDGEPVLLCHSAVANQFNFTEPPGNSLVDVLVKEGFDCWAIELRGSRSSAPPYVRRRWAVSMDDYLAHDLPAAVKHIRQQTRYAKVHWVGHSMGGMLLYAYVAAHGPGPIASAATLGAPPGFEGVRFRNPQALLFLHGLCPVAFDYLLRGLTPLLTWLRPRTRLVPINWDNVHPDIGAATFFNLLEAPPPNAAKELASWAAGKPWHMLDDAVDVEAGLKNLRVPLLAIFGAADPLAPVANAEAFFAALPGRDKKFLMLSAKNKKKADYNHADLAFGKNSVKDVFEPIADWFKKHPCAQQVSAEDLAGKAEDSMRAAGEQRKKAAGKKTTKKKTAAKKKKRASKKKTAAKKSTAKEPDA